MSRHSPSADLSPNLLTTESGRELASGVDSLYLSGWTELPEGLLARLDVAKGRAQAAENAVSFRFGGVEFGLAPYGLQKYQYRLSNEYGVLGITPSSKLPPIRFQPRAEFLQGLGVESAVDAIGYLLESEVGEHRLSVARVDLFSDWQGWSPTFADEDRFVRRARHLVADKEGDDWTGFTFGRRSSKRIGGRIYDKTAEIAGKARPVLRPRRSGITSPVCKKTSASVWISSPLPPSRSAAAISLTTSGLAKLEACAVSPSGEARLSNNAIGSAGVTWRL